MLHLAKALLPEGWRTDVRLDIGPDGLVTDVTPGVPANGAERVQGVALPGLADLHSHSFQRALAGLAERWSGEGATFWSWRRTMYEFLARIGPEELWSITAQLYVELLKGGYTTVCEFHYLHRDPAGQVYDDPALLSVVVHEAAATVGIGLTLLPSLYMSGGFGDQPLEGPQRRFLTTPDQFLELLGRLDGTFRDLPDRRLGIAPHSLRAAAPPLIREVVEVRRRHDPFLPVHMHLAEQEQEVADCLARFGARPGQVAMDTVGIDHHWCLVHCTHLEDAEARALARSGAVVGLCPTTEANLGDGIFPLRRHLDEGGRFGVGSDANLCRNWAEELRLLEYGQRLAGRRRAVAASEPEPSVGAALVSRASRGGSQAAGRLMGKLAPGYAADLVVLDTSDPALVGREDDQLLDALVFATAAPPVRHVMVSGVWRIRDGAHAAERSIEDAYRRTVRRLVR
jgi:formimidoylglutamate deiminase